MILRYRITVISVLITVIPASFAADSRHPSAAELNNQGVRAAQDGQFATGVDYLRRAVTADPNDPLLRTNLSGVLTEWAGRLEHTGEVDQAERLLQEALQHEPANGRAFALLGDIAYFRRSDFAKAVDYWKRAYATLPAEEQRMAADRIAQAQRDQTIEHGFASKRTAHFEIRLARQQGIDLEALERLLEEAYARLMNGLGSGPSTITVIVYSRQDLRRTYNQRDWALGFYDGRLRLAWNEVASALAPSLIAHELTHAFLRHAYAGGLPIWVHEGLAQVEEGARPMAEQERRWEEGVRSGSSWVPVKWLDRRFTHPSNTEDVARAYVEARLIVARLIERHGMGQFTAFLKQLSDGAAIEATYDAAFAPDRWARTDAPIFE